MKIGEEKIDRYIWKTEKQGFEERKKGV